MIFYLSNFSWFFYIIWNIMQKICDPKELEQLKYRNKVILLHFTTEWCNPCKLSRKLLESQIIHSSNLAVVAEVNCDEAEQLVLDYRIEGVPTLVLLDKNLKIIDKTMGYLPQKVKQLFKKMKQSNQNL